MLTVLRRALCCFREMIFNLFLDDLIIFAAIALLVFLGLQETFKQFEIKFESLLRA